MHNIHMFYKLNQSKFVIDYPNSTTGCITTVNMLHI